MGLVDLDDVAAVAAAALLDGGHLGATFELRSGESLARREMAAIIGEALGRPVEATVVVLENWQTRNAPGLRGEQRERPFKMFRHYHAVGLPAGNANILRCLLGRSPTRFADFVKRQASMR